MNAILSLLFVVGLQPSAVSSQLAALGWQQSEEADAMSLAVEYFDPNHERGLTRESKETIFMFDALSQIHQQVPETRPIHRSIHGDWTTHSFNSLVIHTRDELGEVKVERKELERILAAVAPVTPRCKRQTMGNRLESLDCEYYMVGADVDVPSSAWLTSHGIRLIRLIEDHDNVDLYFCGDLCDPFPLLNKLRREPDYKKVLQGSEMEVDMPSSRMGDPGSAIRFESKRDDPKLTSPFQLRFTIGWGDCPAGCISHHSWIVECVQARNTYGPERFDVKLIKEEGAPLNEQMRSCLRCGSWRGE